jgi:hypothetical protein
MPIQYGMRFLLVLLLAMLPLSGQQGQGPGRPGWPCVSGRAVDPSYLEVTESSGGQVFLFQKGEMQHAAAVMSAPFTHPQTLFRAVGEVNGDRIFEFPVDSGVESMLVMASIQCRKEVALLDPGGSEVVPARASANIDLRSGRIVRVDQPSFGTWKLRVSGQGLFVFSVTVKSKSSIGSVRFGTEGEIEVGTAGFSGEVRFFALDALGQQVAELPARYEEETRLYRLRYEAPQGQRYRVAMTGRDDLGWPVLRVYANLWASHY